MRALVYGVGGLLLSGHRFDMCCAAAPAAAAAAGVTHPHTLYGCGADLHQDYRGCIGCKQCFAEPRVAAASLFWVVDADVSLGTSCFQA